MNVETYQTEALRTATDKYYKSTPEVIQGLEYVLEDVCSNLDIVDDLKKHLFYGRQLGPAAEVAIEQAFNFKATDEHLQVNHVHGIIGILTEANELGRHLQNALNGDQISEDKILDEVGDLLWYVNLLLVSTGLSFEQAFSGNIAKLQARYPEKFTPERAINRDERTEQQALVDSVASLEM